MQIVVLNSILGRRAVAVQIEQPNLSTFAAWGGCSKGDSPFFFGKREVKSMRNIPERQQKRHHDGHIQEFHV